MKLFLALALAMVGFAASAHAAEFRIGAGNVYVGDDKEHDNSDSYFTTYPGTFCNTKAVRIAVLGNGPEAVKIGRVYFSWQQKPENGPYAAFVKVNKNLGQGQSSDWIKLPQKYGCLERVRVYAEAAYGNRPTNGASTARVVVIGSN